jgi:hypothetical protein
MGDSEIGGYDMITRRYGLFSGLWVVVLREVNGREGRKKETA